MAKYLDKLAIESLDSYRQEIFAIRERAYTKHGIDILDNDTLSSVSIYNLVSQYDPDYNINFARNGEDAISNRIEIEQKCSRVENDKKLASFMFHAMGNLIYDRYIFVARHKDNLDLLRIYDISQKKNLKIIHKHLTAERDAWLERGKKDQSKMKRDVVLLSEKMMKEQLTNLSKIKIDTCEVIRG